jgi:aminoglycoside phosphotransferase (APT) family kinase protein
MPAADVEVTIELVRSLLRAQHPDLASRSIAPLAHGWDNELFRLGDDRIVRLPRRASAAALMENELAWLPVLARHCTLPVSVAERRGAPGEGYPYAWSVLPYLPGHPIAEGMLDEINARILGRFVRELHVEAPAEAPRNPLRGVPLGCRHDRFEQALAALRPRMDVAPLRATWERCLETPAWDGPPVWLHGDLHALNVLWNDRRVCGVIDFGDLGVGDPAVDLVIAFISFEERDRALFLDECAADAATIERARGWALALGALFAASDDPVLAQLGGRAIANAV